MIYKIKGLYDQGRGLSGRFIHGETVWLRYAQMAGLFVRDRTVIGGITIGRHIRNVFAEGEFAKESNVQYLHIANSDNLASLYSLDVITSLGYRVKRNPPC